jgi:hypothetical protein
MSRTLRWRLRCAASPEKLFELLATDAGRSASGLESAAPQLLALKAAADFGIDLRNHDRQRTWREGYVDQ